MKDLWLVRRNLGLALRRSRGFVLFIALGSGLVLLCVGLVAQTDRAGRDVLESRALRTIELSSMHGQLDALPLTGQRITEIRAMPEVAAVDPWLQAGFNTIDDTMLQGVFWATPRIGYIQPPITESIRPEVFPLADDEVVLPAHYADTALTGALGQSIQIQYTQRTGANVGEAVDSALTVVAVYDESTFTVDGPTAAYTSFDTVLRFAAAREGTTPNQFGAQFPYPKAMVEVRESADVLAVEQRLREMGFAASSIQSQVQSLPRAMQLLSGLGTAMAVILTLYCVGAGVTIGGGMVRNRQREIGLLKAVGFSRVRVARLFLAELAGFGLLAGLIGVLLGNAAVLVAGRLVAGTTFLGAPMVDAFRAPDWWWNVLLLAAPALALALGGLLPARRAATLPPDEALRQD